MNDQKVTEILDTKEEDSSKTQNGSSIISTGDDTTSVNEVQIIMVEDEGDFLGDSDLMAKVKEFAEDPKEYEDEEAAQGQLEVGKNLLKTFLALLNRAAAGVEAIKVTYAILVGLFLHRLKAHAKNAGFYWGPYATKQLRFLSPRTRQRYMQLAARTDAHKYAPIGIEKLLLLVRATDDIKQETQDPIGNLFSKYGLPPFNPDGDYPLDQFEKDVDLALNAYTLEKAGIEFNLQDLRKFTIKGGKVDGTVINQLALVQESGGDISRHMQSLLDKGKFGRKPQKGQDRAEDFKKLSTRIESSITFIFENPEQSEQLDVVDIDSLREKLEELKAFVLENHESAVEPAQT